MAGRAGSTAVAIPVDLTGAAALLSLAAAATQPVLAAGGAAVGVAIGGTTAASMAAAAAGSAAAAGRGMVCTCMEIVVVYGIILCIHRHALPMLPL